MSVFKRLNQFVEWEVIAENGLRAVVVRLLFQAVAADFPKSCGQRATWAAWCFEPWQIRCAGVAEDVFTAGSGTKQAVLGQ